MKVFYLSTLYFHCLSLSLSLALSFTQPSKKRRKVAPDALQARVDALQAVGGV